MIRHAATLSCSSPQRIKVAILGSGLTGCTVASTLLQASSNATRFDITMFEAGRVVGGRMATRSVIMDVSNYRYRFDHGCPFISSPTTSEFQMEFDRWKENGWLQPWKGSFGTVTYHDTFPYLSLEMEERQEKFVGVPSMSSICQNMVLSKYPHSTQHYLQQHRLSESNSEPNESTIKVLTQTLAKVTHLPSSVSLLTNQYGHAWELHDQKLASNDNSLGTFDWLILTDRNSALPHRLDLNHANVDERDFMNAHIHSQKICTTMVILDKPLPLHLDAVWFDPERKNPQKRKRNFGTLAWIARDSSKPERSNTGDTDQKECWVLQSTELEAQTLLDMSELKDAGIETIQSKIASVMVQDFLTAIPILLKADKGRKCSDNNNNDVMLDMPNIIYSQGHRWGAAFPKYVQAEVENEDGTFKSTKCFVNKENKYIICGDYFGQHHGTVEGAFLSGRAAALELLQQSI